MSDPKSDPNLGRRALLVALTSGGVTSFLLPARWVLPVIVMSPLPAHAGTSAAPRPPPPPYQPPAPPPAPNVPAPDDTRPLPRDASADVAQASIDAGSCSLPITFNLPRTPGGFAHGWFDLQLPDSATDAGAGSCGGGVGERLDALSFHIFDGGDAGVGDLTVASRRFTLDATVGTPYVAAGNIEGINELPLQTPFVLTLRERRDGGLGPERRIQVYFDERVLSVQIDRAP